MESDFGGHETQTQPVTWKRGWFDADRVHYVTHWQMVFEISGWGSQTVFWDSSAELSEPQNVT